VVWIHGARVAVCGMDPDSGNKFQGNRRPIHTDRGEKVKCVQLIAGELLLTACRLNSKDLPSSLSLTLDCEHIFPHSHIINRKLPVIYHFIRARASLNCFLWGERITKYTNGNRETWHSLSF
jgi:hypothetical protein